MATTFRPYGLIRTPIQQTLYRKAHIANIYASLDNPKEFETVALMENILYRNIFSDEMFTINSQQPPVPNSKRRCDIVVRYLEQGSGDIKTLCFVECKRTSVSQAYSLEKLELQAWEYCTEYLESLNDSDTTQFVLQQRWRARTSGCGSVKGYRGKVASAGDWGEYWDIGDEQHRTELERLFSYVKRYPPTLHAGQTASTYGETYQALAAPGMHPTPAIYSGSLADAAGPSSAYHESASTPGGFTPSYDKTSVTTSGIQVSSYYASELSYTGSQMDSSGGQLGSIGELSYRPPEQSLILGSSESQRLVVPTRRQPHMTSKDDFIFRDSRGEKRCTKAQDWNPTTHEGKAAMRHRIGDITYISFDKID